MLDIKKVRRIVKAQQGLHLPSLIGNPYMYSTGIPTEGMIDERMQRFQQQQVSQLNTISNAVTTQANPEKAASQILAGKAQVVDGQFQKNPLFNAQQLSNIGGYVGKGADFLGNFVQKDYSGKYGAIQQGGDQLFDQASNVAMSINPVVGGIMKAGGLVSDVLSKYAGMGTDNRTPIDAVLGSKFLSLTPMGMINGFLGSKTQDFHADKYTIEQVGGSYGGSVRDIASAQENANKKYGLFSGRARRRADRQIDEARRQQNIMTDIAEDATNRAYLGANMSDLNHIRYGFDLNGGYDQRYIRAAKFGAKLKRVKKINFHKQGGEINDIIEWNPIITEAPREWEPIITLKQGGKTEELPQIKEKIEIEETTQKNIIPEGALHARKHNMENADNLTKKGIPVIDNEGEQQAEIEKNEIIFTLEVTKKLEELYSKYTEGSQKEKDEVAVQAGNLLVEQILFNTEDRTGLIDTLKNGGTIEVKQFGGPVSNFAEDKLYQLWREKLPENLRQETDDYDLRGAYEAGLQPELVNSVTAEYHLGSRNPKTGLILKSQTHPTFAEAIKADATLGYLPYIGEDGRVYTSQEQKTHTQIPIKDQLAREFKIQGLDPNYSQDLKLNENQLKVRQQIVDQLKEKGFSLNQIRAILMNSFAESSFNPEATDNGGAKGLFQLQGEELKNYIKKYKNDFSVKNQVEYLVDIINNRTYDLDNLLNEDISTVKFTNQYTDKSVLEAANAIDEHIKDPKLINDILGPALRSKYVKKGVPRGSRWAGIDRTQWMDEFRNNKDLSAEELSLILLGAFERAGKPLSNRFNRRVYDGIE